MGDILYMYENLHLFKNSEAYRRAFVEQSGKGVNDVQNPSPVAESYTSSYASYAVAPPKQRSRGTYVQRWKVLRDRNKSLPKLDFNVKASGVPKKFQGAGSFSRSHTYDSMKLPSLSTCSVITGVSGKSVHSDGYKKKEDKTIQGAFHFERWKYNTPLQRKEQHSESYNDISTLRDYREVKAYLSKSLQSLNQDDKKSPQQKSQQKEETKNKNSHRYENITYKKHLLKRHLGNNVVDNSKRSKEGNAQFKMDREKTQLKTKVQREIVYVKDHTKELPKLLTNDTHDNKSGSIYPKETKTHPVPAQSGSPSTEDKHHPGDHLPDSITMATPDNNTTSSPLTLPSAKSRHTNNTNKINHSSITPDSRSRRS